MDTWLSPRIHQGLEDRRGGADAPERNRAKKSHPRTLVLQANRTVITEELKTRLAQQGPQGLCGL